MVEAGTPEAEGSAMTWALASAEARAAASASFKIPPRTKREALCVGEFAKLVFVDLPDLGERMWVEIVATEGGRYRGRLRNSPVVIRDLEENDLIEFGPEHVANWADPIEFAEGGVQ
jgi:uncharacterized protein YegJ (DUF2314 family)